MIALETWRDQNQQAYFVTDKSIIDRFKGSWVKLDHNVLHRGADG